MKNCLLLCILGLLALTAGNLSATQVFCPLTNVTFDQLVQYDSVADACAIQDKLFWGFTYTPTGLTEPATGVNASAIFQAGPSSQDVHGWNFSSSMWTQPFTISYNMEVCPVGSICANQVITGLIILAGDASYAPTLFGATGNETVTFTYPTGLTSLTLTKGVPYESGIFSSYTAGPVSIVASWAKFTGCPWLEFQQQHVDTAVHH
jgi:hypothetical protein